MHTRTQAKQRHNHDIPRVCIRVVDDAELNEVHRQERNSSWGDKRDALSDDAHAASVEMGRALMTE